MVANPTKMGRDPKSPPIIHMSSAPRFLNASTKVVLFSVFAGASFFVIGLHASLLSTSDTPAITEELVMEEV